MEKTVAEICHEGAPTTPAAGCLESFEEGEVKA
jgi:hypothetical protein